MLVHSSAPGYVRVKVADSRRILILVRGWRIYNRHGQLERGQSVVAGVRSYMSIISKKSVWRELCVRRDY